METITKPTTYQYTSDVKWDMEMHQAILTSGTRMPILVAPPPEFGGTDTVWSPEQLLASAVAACYATTLLHFAKLLRVKLKELSVNISMEVEKNSPAGFTATRYHLYPRIRFDGNVSSEVADNLLSKVKRYCIVSNSVIGEILIEADVR